MKLDLTKQPLDLEGNTMNGQTLGQIIGFHLANDSKNDPLKFYDWARVFHNEGIVDLDKSDQVIFENFIKQCDKMPNLFKGQLLYAFEEAKEKHKEKK